MFIEFNTENGKVTILKELIAFIWEKSVNAQNQSQDIPLLLLANGQAILLSEDYQIAIDRWMAA